MTKVFSTYLFILLINCPNVFGQNLPDNFLNSEILIETVTPEELYQRSFNRVKAAQDSGSILGDWKVQPFAFDDRQYKSIAKDYKKFRKVIKKKGLKFRELEKAEFEENLNVNTKAGTYYVTYDFIVFEDEGKKRTYLMVVLDIKILAPNKEVIYVGSWKGLGRKIKKTPQNPND